MSITVLTLSNCHLSIAVSNDLGKLEATASYPSNTPSFNMHAAMRSQLLYPPMLIPISAIRVESISFGLVSA